MQELTLASYTGLVEIVDSIEKYNNIRKELSQESVWGFDTETKPCFKKGVSNMFFVSLLQLSSAKKTYLFRLNKLPLQKEVIALLSDAKIVKVGVSIRDDIKSLRKLHDFEPKGFVELQELVKKYGIEGFSLKKMVGIVLNLRISKAAQLSNWEAPELKEKQIRYAATDSWMSREIYLKLLKTKKMISHQITYRVLYADTDAMGVMYYANYLRVYEAARSDFMRKLGLSLSEIAEEGVICPVINVNAEYFVPAKFDWEVKVVSIVEELPMARLKFIQEMYSPDGVLLNRAAISLSFVDSEKFRAVRCPKWIFEKFEANF